MRLPVSPLHRRPKKRLDVATFLVLIGLAGMIYLMEAQFPSDRDLARTDAQTKEMNEFTAWAQEATNDIGDEVQRQRLLAILKTKWPECIEQNLTSLQCKALIDNDEIEHIESFTEAVDRAISTEMDDNHNFASRNSFGRRKPLPLTISEMKSSGRG
eukprot:scaffold7864_cov122-Skeletonema_dohrnii-CCMP3373.AAC.6